VKKFILVAPLVFVIAIALIAWARRPEGTTVAKDLEEYFRSASEKTGLTLIEARSHPTEDVSLPFSVALRHRVKRVAGLSRVTVRTTDYAMCYVFETDVNSTRMECLTRISGDHVIGITIRHQAENAASASQLRDVITRKFAGYEVITEEMSAGVPAK